MTGVKQKIYSVLSSKNFFIIIAMTAIFIFIAVFAYKKFLKKN